MPCYLLTWSNSLTPNAYDDEELKDLVGSFPRCFCAQCNPPRDLTAGETSSGVLIGPIPCWKPAEICVP